MRVITILFLFVCALASSQEFYFPFNNSWSDQMGNYSGTAQNSATFSTTYKIEGTHAADFNQTSTNRFLISSVDLSSGAGVMNLTFRTNRTTGRGVIFTNQSTSGTSQGIRLFHDTEYDRLVFGVHNGVSENQITTATNSILTGVDYFIQVVTSDWNGANFKIYIDGALANTDTVAQAGGGSITDLSIGCSVEATAYSVYGYIDQLSYYSCRLPVASLTALYTNRASNYTVDDCDATPVATESPVLNRIIYYSEYYGARILPDTLAPSYDYSLGIYAQIGTEDYDGVCPSGGSRWEDADCAVNDFTQAPLRALTDTNDYTYVKYFDINHVGSALGTYSNPYNSWDDITWSDNTAYVFKRGTTIPYTSGVNWRGEQITNTNIYIGAYGTGADPHIEIEGVSNMFWFSTGADSVTIRDLYFTQADVYILDYQNSFSPIQIQMDGSVDIVNVEIRWAGFGIRVEKGESGTSPIGARDVRIIDCLIHDTHTEGVYGTAQYFEIAFSDIHDVNYFSVLEPRIHIPPLPAGTNTGSTGDVVELPRVEEFWCHNSTLDHGSTPNKATLMLHNDPVYAIKYIIEDNILVGPVQGSDLTYQGSVQTINSYSDLILRNNLIFASTTGPRTMAMWTAYGKDSIVGNVWVGYSQAAYIAWQPTTNSVYVNNTFYNNTYAIVAANPTNITASLNNIFYNNTYNLSNVTPVSNLGNTTANPSFVNAGTSPYTSDFSLRSYSASVGVGTSVAYRIYDLMGNVTPQETYHDAGAIEYKP
jgi:hypothetical protein